MGLDMRTPKGLGLVVPLTPIPPLIPKTPNPLPTPGVSPTPIRALFNSTCRVEDMGEWLGRLENIRTFVWEDNLPYGEPSLIQIPGLEDTRFKHGRLFMTPHTDQDISSEPSIIDHPKSAIFAESTAPYTSGTDDTTDETLHLEILDAHGAVPDEEIRKMWDETMDEGAVDYLNYQQERRWIWMTPNEIRAKHWKALCNPEICEKDSAIQSNIGEYESFPWRWEQDPPLLWRPKAILNQLSPYQKQRLKHLVLIANLDQVTLVKPEDQILSLKEFTNLTHLEIDLSVLQFQQGNFLQIPPNGIPISLTKVLPQSISVLRLISRFNRFQNLHYMLWPLLEQKEQNQYPELREISIRYTELDTPYETFTRIQPLCKQFECMGIELLLEEIPEWKLRGNLPIDISPLDGHRRGSFHYTNTAIDYRTIKNKEWGRRILEYFER